MTDDKKPKRYAELLDDGLIEIHADAKTVFVRKVRDSDYEEWDLEKPKPKRGRKSKAKADGEDDSKDS